MVGTTGRTLPQLLATNGDTAVAISRYTPEFGRPQTTAVTNVYRAAVSVDGKFRDQGRWTAFAHYGKSDYLATFKNVVTQANLRAALESIVVGGQIVCNPTIVALYGADPGCQPLNPFGVGSVTPDAAKYIAGRDKQQNVVNTMKAAGANFGDEPFSTWAGPASVAAGVDWREISLQQTTDRVFNLRVNGVLSQNYLPQGFNYVTGANGADSGNAKNIDLHSQSIVEEFAEINLPMLKVAEFKADLNAGYRFEQNSYSGETKNWKFGGIIQVFNGFTLRAAKSLDSRVPNLSELYTGNNTANGQINAANPDGGCPVATCGAAYTYTNISTRTPDLKPEVGHSTSIGFTLNPEWLLGVSMGVDFWKIVIDGQIGSTNNVVNACYGAPGTIYAGNPQTDLCSNIVRVNGPNTPIAFAYNPVFNIATVTEAGVDYDFHYKARLGDFASWLSGNFNFDTLATYIRTNTSQARAVAPIDNNGLPGNPKWRMTFQQTYANGPLRFSLVEKMVGPQSFILDNSATGGAVPYYNNRIPTFWYVNAQVAYTVSSHGTGNLQVYANLKNLTNVDPPLILPTQGAFPAPTNVVNNYDVSGQTWTLGVRYRH
jgi:hypothetical protein